MKTTRWLSWCTLILALMACSWGNLTTNLAVWSQKGELAIVSPELEAKFHFPVPTDGSLQKVDVAISSTFEMPMDARLTINGLGPIPCRLEPNITTSTCPQVPIQVGQNTLVVETFKVDGVTVVSASRVFNWLPYSPLDLGMQKIARLVGQEDPKWGYNMVALLMSGILALLATKLGNAGAIVAFIIMAFGFAYFASAEIVALMITSIYGIVIGYFSIIIIKAILDNFQHNAFVKKGDFIGFYGGRGGPKGAQIVDAIGRAGGQLKEPQPRYMPQRPGRYLPPMQTQYLESGDEVYDDGLITYEEVPARGFWGFVGRLLNRKSR